MKLLFEIFTDLKLILFHLILFIFILSMYFIFLIGKISLDDVFKERDTLNHSIVGMHHFFILALS